MKNLVALKYWPNTSTETQEILPCLEKEIENAVKGVGLCKSKSVKSSGWTTCTTIYYLIS